MLTYQPKAQPWASGKTFNPLLKGRGVSGGRSTHFVAEGEHGKGQCHHKRHGKDYHVHIAIISHIGHLQQFCYVYVTLLWPILTDTAGDVPD